MKRSRWMITAFVTVVLIISGFQVATAQAEIPPAEEITDAFMAAWNEGELEALDDITVPEFVVHDPPGPDIEGLEAYKDSIVDSRNGSPDAELTFEEAVVVGDRFYTRWIYGGTNTGESEALGPPSGQPFSMMGATVGQFEDGKIVEMWHNSDDLGMMMQLGRQVGLPPLPVKHALAALDDIILYYEIVGEGEPLLLLNGGTGCTESWAWGNQYETLGRHYTVIAPDSRAQGRSTDSDQPLSYQLMADDMVALLDHLGIDSAHVVGWSDGGNTGLDMAMRYPERVRSLVATGAQSRADGMIPDELEWAETLTVDSFPQAWLDQCYRSVAADPEHLPVVIEKLRDMWLAEEYVPNDGLADIVAPVLVLEGTVEDFLLNEHVEDLVAAIPNAELMWIEEAGHFAPSEKAEEWNTEVLTFLEAVEADRMADTVAEIEALVEQTMEEAEIPGIALGIVKNGELVHAEGFGVTELGGEAPVTPASIFHLASIGKTAVGLAVLQLVEEGKIDLDATVTEYLPYFTLADPEAQDITIRQLLSHTGGVSDIEDWIVEWRDKEVRTEDGALEEYVKSLSGDSLLFKPGEDWSYSSIGFDVLGDVIAKASGQSFEEYVQDHLLSPLGMEGSSFLLEDVESELLASPHMYDEEGAVEKIDFFPYSRIHAPSSTLYSSVEDMARYAMANMNQGELDGVRILPSSIYADMWSPYASSPWAEWGGPLLANYGLGWWVGESTGGPAVGGYGADPGFQSHLTMIPQEGMAIIVMANVFDPEEGSLHAFEIGNAVMEVLLGEE